MKLSDDRDE
jgi:hypothetical protein